MALQLGCGAKRDKQVDKQCAPAWRCVQGARHAGAIRVRGGLAGALCVCKGRSDCCLPRMLRAHAGAVACTGKSSRLLHGQGSSTCHLRSKLLACLLRKNAGGLRSAPLGMAWPVCDPAAAAARRLRGHFRAAGVPLKRRCREFKVTPDALLPVGTPLTAAHFAPGQYVDIQGARPPPSSPSPSPLCTPHVAPHG